MDNLTEIMGDLFLPENPIIVPQIIEENGLVYEQTNENGCISRICIGEIIEGEIIPITPVIETIQTTLEEKVEILAEKVEQLEILMV